MKSILASLPSKKPKCEDKYTADVPVDEEYFHNCVDLLDIDSSSVTCYALSLARIFWTADQLKMHLVKDINDPDKSSQTTRTPFSGTDMQHVIKIKSKLSSIF